MVTPEAQSGHPVELYAFTKADVQRFQADQSDAATAPLAAMRR